MKATVNFFSSKHAYFEYGDGLDYKEGELYFEDKVLIDYSGVSFVPNKVLNLLEANNYNVNEVRTAQNGKELPEM